MIKPIHHRQTAARLKTIRLHATEELPLYFPCQILWLPFDFLSTPFCFFYALILFNIDILTQAIA